MESDWKLIVNLVLADFHAVPVKFLSSKSMKIDFCKKLLQPFPSVFVRTFSGRAENWRKGVAFFVEKCK